MEFDIPAVLKRDLNQYCVIRVIFRIKDSLPHKARLSGNGPRPLVAGGVNHDNR
jgi:hypothetical protein